LKLVYQWLHAYPSLTENDDSPDCAEHYELLMSLQLTVCTSYGLLRAGTTSGLIGTLYFEPSGARNGYLHIAMSRCAWGRGLADEAAALCIRDLFETQPDATGFDTAQRGHVGTKSPPRSEIRFLARNPHASSDGRRSRPFRIDPLPRRRSDSSLSRHPSAVARRGPRHWREILGQAHHGAQPGGIAVRGDEKALGEALGLYDIGYQGYAGFELCHPLPVVDGQTVGLDFVDKNAQLAAEYIRGVLAQASKAVG
jgi:hypothetical protein